MRRICAIRSRIASGLHSIIAGAILLLVVLYYLGDDGQASFFPSYLISLACLGLLFIPGGHYQALKDYRLILAIALIFWLGVSPLWSISFTWKYVGYAALLATFLIGTMFAARKFPRLPEWVITVVILSGATSAAFSVYLHYFVDYSPLVEKDRLFAIGRNYQPTIGALSYSVPLIMAAVRTAMTGNTLQRSTYVLIAIPLVWALFLTGTRGAWVGLLATAVLAAFVLTDSRWRTRSAIAIAGGIAAGGLAILGLLMVLGYGDFILRRAFSFRPEIWLASIERITAGNWLLGNGINVSAAVSWQHLTFDHAHSIYLSTLFYGGVVGLALLTAVLVSTALPLLRRSNTELHVMAFSLLVFACVTLSLDGDRLVEKVDHLWMVFWLPLLIAWIARRPKSLARA